MLLGPAAEVFVPVEAGEGAELVSTGVLLEIPDVMDPSDALEELALVVSTAEDWVELSALFLNVTDFVGPSGGTFANSITSLSGAGVNPNEPVIGLSAPLAGAVAVTGLI